MADKPPLPYYRLYKDKAGEWRWTYVARNGNSIAASSEGYSRKADAERSIEIMRESAGVAVWTDEGEAEKAVA